MSKDYTEELQQMVNLVLKTGQEDNQAHFLKEKEQLNQKLAAELASLKAEHDKQLAQMTKKLKEAFHRQEQRELLATSQAVMIKKQAYLTQLFDQVKDEMGLWTIEEFGAMVAPVFKTNQLKGSVMVTMGRYSQGYLSESLLREFAAEHPQTIDYQLSETVIDDEGGFILSQGGIDYNFLSSSILEESYEQMELSLAKGLFEDEVRA